MPKSFSNFLTGIECLPKWTDGHLWADYIELLSLVNADQIVSKADILDLISDRRDLLETDAGEEGASDSPPEYNDVRQRQLDDYFRLLSFREGTFQDFYPFTIAQNGDSIQRKAKLTAKNKLYLFLLAASNLGYFSAKRRNDLTSYFEVISQQALIAYLPVNSTVRMFGKNPANSDGYTGKIEKKLSELAEDIFATPIVKNWTFKQGDSGDKGLDIVAWVPLGDNESGFLTIFGQCACTDKWTDKQLAVSHAAWSTLLQFSMPPIPVIFFPYCFRDASGNWFNRSEIKSTIPVDRLRLVKLLWREKHPLKNVSYKFVDELIQVRQGIF